MTSQSLKEKIYAKVEACPEGVLAFDIAMDVLFDGFVLSHTNVIRAKQVYQAIADLQNEERLYQARGRYYTISLRKLWKHYRQFGNSKHLTLKHKIL